MLTQALVCTVCENSFSNRNHWLNHLLYLEHETKAREYFPQWGDDIKESAVVVHSNFGLKVSSGPVLWYVSKGNCLATDFVWFPDNPHLGFIQFENKEQADEIIMEVMDASGISCGVQIWNQVVHFKKVSEFTQIEWAELLSSKGVKDEVPWNINLIHGSRSCGGKYCITMEDQEEKIICEGLAGATIGEFDFNGIEHLKMKPASVSLPPSPPQKKAAKPNRKMPRNRRQTVKVKPYACHRCEKKYFTEAPKNLHEATCVIDLAERGVRPDKQLKPFACQWCGKKFPMEKAKNTHEGDCPIKRREMERQRCAGKPSKAKEKRRNAYFGRNRFGGDYAKLLKSLFQAGF